MKPLTYIKAAGAAVLASGLLAGAAVAHHGWSWAQSEQIELTGRITDIYIGPPHPTLKVEVPAQAGDAVAGLWTVELGNPTQTRTAGFVDGVAKVGDTIVALGNRARDSSEKRMKAVRVSVGGRTFDIYPERIRAN